MKIAIDYGDENERHLPTQAHLNGNGRLRDSRQQANEAADLIKAREGATKNGDNATALDCTIRLKHADFLREAGAGQDNMGRAKHANDKDRHAEAGQGRDEALRKVEQIEKFHSDFRRNQEASSGRKFNSLSQPQGEEPAARDRWEKDRAAKDREAFHAQERGEMPGHQRRMARSHATRGRQQEGAAEEAIQPRPADFNQRVARIDATVADQRSKAQDTVKKDTITR